MNMFVLAVKPGQMRAGIIGILLVLLLIGGALFAGRETAVSASAQGMTEESRRGYLTGLGYALSAAPGEVWEIQIPVEFDETLTAYNALQQTEGMDLTPYRGKRVKCWSYGVINYPGHPAVQARLYVLDDTIVAGDISATEKDGFSHGLRAMAPGDGAKEEENGNIGAVR